MIECGIFIGYAQVRFCQVPTPEKKAKKSDFFVKKGLQYAVMRCTLAMNETQYLVVIPLKVYQNVVFCLETETLRKESD